MRARRIFFLGLGLALTPTLAKTYLIWPFPGSQGLESIRLAHWLYRWAPAALVAGALMAAVGFVGILRARRPAVPDPGSDAAPRQPRTLFWATVALIAALGIYAWTLRISAGTIFVPNLEPQFAGGTSEALPPETLVVAVRSGEVAKAYPIRLIAYHHQVTDTLDGEPIWVTYCTM